MAQRNARCREQGRSQEQQADGAFSKDAPGEMGNGKILRPRD
ncbi:MAG TPA: hypothetical protein PLJ27_27420 [Polyangiaceae bacterium]|nr:hypothetical protein [Polyangiaceae bacterium]HPB96800.1 hypothetical protein [Polyangiaceae bacterium]HQB45532.1 hypothetical protein [Polyangiaceae bacterium]HQF22095.1 hypothetical protein [Polyangiaceae bacterium]HQK21225.1 hypothetical protein [Polyangiaceae bacterium]